MQLFIKYFRSCTRSTHASFLTSSGTLEESPDAAELLFDIRFRISTIEVSGQLKYHSVLLRQFFSPFRLRPANKVALSKSYHNAAFPQPQWKPQAKAPGTRYRMVQPADTLLSRNTVKTRARNVRGVGPDSDRAGQTGEVKMTTVQI
jgi:hypothetical protein